jgi:hypothetical protein
MSIKKKQRSLRVEHSDTYPEFRIMDYKMSLLQQLNYYNIEVADKDKQKYAIEYWKSQGKDVSCLNKTCPSLYSTIGAIAHMVHVRGIGLYDSDLKRLDDAYEQLRGVPVVRYPPHHSAEDSTSKYIGDIEYALDQSVENGFGFDVKKYFQDNDLKLSSIKRISEWFGEKLPELLIAYSGDDPELTEAYSNLGKYGLKKNIDFIFGVISACDMSSTVRARSVRVKKAIPPEKLVMKMKYLTTSPESNLVSVPPENIIDVNEVWLYDVEKRRLILYVAKEFMKLTVKGTTIQNYDEKLSGSKIIRKPETQLDGIGKFSKIALRDLFDGIKGVTGKVKGRTSDSQLILNAF